MTEKQKKDCKKIINVASASAAVGGGLAQIPGNEGKSDGELIKLFTNSLANINLDDIEFV